ncbi:MAG: hypothetical protein JST12_16810 [Armatimonadetes bacterium]|nr:hypothetical protein [Armatimonadota bacterium]
MAKTFSIRTWKDYMSVSFPVLALVNAMLFFFLDRSSIDNRIILGVAWLFIALLSASTQLPRFLSSRKIEIDDHEIRFYGQSDRPTLTQDLADVVHLTEDRSNNFDKAYRVEFRDGTLIKFRGTAERNRDLVALIEVCSGKQFLPHQEARQPATS